MKTDSAPYVDETAAGFLKALAEGGGPPIYQLSVADARGVLSGAQAGEVEKLPTEVEQLTLPLGPKGEVSVRIHRPVGAKGLLPTILYIHGGGWILGDAETHDRLVRELVHGTGAALVFPEYSRSPEERYPVAVEESFAVARWIAENGAEHQLDGSRLAVAGDSVGGNMTIALTLLAKQRGGVQFKQQVLFYPVTDANFETGSYEQFQEGFFLTRNAMKWFWDAYAPDHKQRELSTVSPLRADLEELKGLPPALVITGELDVLRDEGEAYAVRLAQAGVPVTQVRYQAIIHDFVMLNVVSQTPAARGAIAQAITVLREALK